MTTITTVTIINEQHPRRTQFAATTMTNDSEGGH